jgi:hypothetical protein
MMDILKSWMKNSKMDRKSVNSFLSRMKKATGEFTGNAIILRHPKNGTWVVSRYGAVFVAPKNIRGYVDREEQITIITDEHMELTIDLRTGKLTEVRKYQCKQAACQT